MPEAGKTHTAETKAKIGARNKGKKRTPEQIARMREVMLGREHTWGYKISATMRSNGDKQRIGAHNRWHVQREIVKPECKYCTEVPSQDD